MKLSGSFRAITQKSYVSLPYTKDKLPAIATIDDALQLGYLNGVVSNSEANHRVVIHDLPAHASDDAAVRRLLACMMDQMEFTASAWWCPAHSTALLHAGLASVLDMVDISRVSSSAMEALHLPVIRTTFEIQGAFVTGSRGGAGPATDVKCNVLVLEGCTDEVLEHFLKYVSPRWGMHIVVKRPWAAAQRQGISNGQRPFPPDEGKYNGGPSASRTRSSGIDVLAQVETPLERLTGLRTALPLSGATSDDFVSADTVVVTADEAREVLCRRLVLAELAAVFGIPEDVAVDAFPGINRNRARSKRNVPLHVYLRVTDSTGERPTPSLLDRDRVSLLEGAMERVMKSTRHCTPVCLIAVQVMSRLLDPSVPLEIVVDSPYEYFELLQSHAERLCARYRDLSAIYAAATDLAVRFTGTVLS